MLKYYTRHDREEGITLIMPGLPAELTKQCDDIARAFADTNKRSVAVLHYPGIGINLEKKFLFSESVNLATKTITDLIREYKKIWVFGHSWGGLNALRNLEILKNHLVKMVCASPYLGYRDAKAAEDLLYYFFDQYPWIFQREREAVLRKDFTDHDLQHGILNTKIATQRLTAPIKILQAVKDTITPPDLARSYFQDVPNCEYTEVDDDHGFSLDRGGFIANLLEYLG